MDNAPRAGAKKLSPEKQFELRKSIIDMCGQGGKVKDVARALGVSERHVISVRRQFREGGFDGICLKRRGRRFGERRLLTPEQEREAREVIVGKTPEQVRLKRCMWTRRCVGELITREYGITIPVSTLGHYLARWGFSLQKPSKRLSRQDAETVRLREALPAVVRRARKQGADIYWGEEAGVRDAADCFDHAPREGAPRRFNACLLAAVSNRGKALFAVYDRPSPDALIDFMRRLAKDAPRKAILILGSLRIHHAKRVSLWLEKHRDEIEVCYPPPEPPESAADAPVEA